MPDIDVSGPNGNSWFIMGQVRHWLGQIDRSDLVKSYCEEAKNCAGYFDFLQYTKAFCADLGIDVEFIDEGGISEEE